MQNIGYWILDARFRILDIRCKIQDANSYPASYNLNISVGFYFYLNIIWHTKKDFRFLYTRII